LLDDIGREQKYRPHILNINFCTAFHCYNNIWTNHQLLLLWWYWFHN